MNPKELERLKKRGQRVQKRLRKTKLKGQNEAFKISLPDPSCPISLKTWFESYGFLTVHELATISNKSTKTIKRWQQKAGLSNGEPISTPTQNPRTIEVVPEEVWNCKSWFEDMYQKRRCGTSMIAKMINRDVRTVRRKLDYYDIPIRSLKQAARSSNPYCTEKWLEEHYNKRKLSLRECADLAGVVPTTIANWLCRFGMASRDIAEANYWRGRKCQP